MEYVALPEYTSRPLNRLELAGLPAEEYFDAVANSRAFKLLELGTVGIGQETDDVLIVQLASEEVPTRNAVGILYRERLAIVVSRKARRIPVVYPLRATFPPVWHRNSPKPGHPADLCLYFEAAISTLRTMTPASFLKRVEWWMQATANETLHPADQAVEQLFFRTPYELVLPFDFEARQSSRETLYFSRDRNQDREAGTFIGAYLPSGEAPPGAPQIALVQIDMPPTVHGAVRNSPTTLGELSDWMAEQGADLKAHLTKYISSDFPTGGAGKNTGPERTTLLIRAPVVRMAGGAIEAVQYRAYFVALTLYELGSKMDVLFELEDKYFNGVGAGPAPGAINRWRPVRANPVEVSFQNDRAASRRQSGVTEAGPAGVLLGVGSLGSAVHNIWLRSGWGSWTVVDKDHVKAHNITRHIATFDQVGMTKVQAVLEHAELVAIGESLVRGIEADALDGAHAELMKALGSADIVVDVTTTLDYPRKASLNAALARHASMFVSPSGSDGVILLEDTNRATTLLSLEAQYYRAIISEPWGEHHLRNNLGSFLSGASCRDISVRLPYSAVLAHAANQSEQLMRLLRQDAAVARVWSRDADSGGISVNYVPAAAQLILPLGKFTAFLDKGLEDKLFALREAALPKETGGVLLGYWDLNINALVLVDVIPAPVDSESSETAFVRGTEGLVEAVTEVRRRTGGIVGYVGEWHSHPPGVRADASSTDMKQLATLALRMLEDGLPVASLIVGEGEIQLMQGQIR